MLRTHGKTTPDQRVSSGDTPSYVTIAIGPRTMTIALHDIIVLDFSQGLSGPFCSLLLGDMGARVLKVEPRRVTGHAS